MKLEGDELTRTVVIIGHKIRTARIARGLTQEELARRIGRGWNQSLVSRYERGLAVPGVEVLSRLAEGLGAELMVEFVLPNARERDAE